MQPWANLMAHLCIIRPRRMDETGFGLLHGGCAKYSDEADSANVPPIGLTLGESKAAMPL